MVEVWTLVFLRMHLRARWIYARTNGSKPCVNCPCVCDGQLLSICRIHDWVLINGLTWSSLRGHTHLHTFTCFPVCVLVRKLWNHARARCVTHLPEHGVGRKLLRLYLVSRKAVCKHGWGRCSARVSGRDAYRYVAVCVGKGAQIYIYQL